MNKPGHRIPWASATPFDPSKIPNPSDLVDREFATRFLAERSVLNEGIRPLRNKIGGQIDTALKTGKLKSNNDKFQFGDLIAWAKTKRNLSSSVSDIASISTGSCSLTMPALTVTGFGYSIPTTFDECQIALKEAYKELGQLRNENLQQQKIIVELTHYREKAESRSQNAKKTGAKGGRPSKK